MSNPTAQMRKDVAEVKAAVASVQWDEQLSGVLIVIEHAERLIDAVEACLLHSFTAIERVAALEAEVTVLRRVAAGEAD